MGSGKTWGYLVGVFSAAIVGYYAGQWVHTPQWAWTADENGDGLEDIVFESRDGKTSVLYKVSPPDAGYQKFLSGEKASAYFNERLSEENRKDAPSLRDLSSGRWNLETKWRESN
ncbi:hypothetical protein J4210_04370 [Candidatus Woesearchaeota archaeon]|nr:hypothetical protein [Candidatus Woesearchaeota archaeon]